DRYHVRTSCWQLQRPDMIGPRLVMFLAQCRRRQFQTRRAGGPLAQVHSERWEIAMHLPADERGGDLNLAAAWFRGNECVKHRRRRRRTQSERTLIARLARLVAQLGSIAQRRQVRQFLWCKTPSCLRSNGERCFHGVSPRRRKLRQNKSAVLERLCQHALDGERRSLARLLPPDLQRALVCG